MQAKTMQGRDRSTTFAMTHSVNAKQGGVVAPTLFSFYLTDMLEVASKVVHEGIYIQTGHGPVQVDDCTTKYPVRQTLFVDDAPTCRSWQIFSLKVSLDG